MDYINTPMNKIGRVVTGKTPSTAVPEYYDGEIMFITPTELHTDFVVERSEKTITQAGFDSIKTNTIRGTSVMVGCIGWDMGNVALCTETCATNQQINSITAIKSAYNPLYLYYWLKTKKDYLFSIASVTRTPILSKSTFEEILVPMPKKDKQDAVARVLSTVDKKIMLNNRINDNLEQQAKLLYDYWFTQFDFPDENGNPYRASGGQMEWNDVLNRHIPVGWKAKSLAELMKKNTTAFDYTSTQPVIDLSVMPSGSIALSQLNTSDNFTTNLYQMKKGDILFGSIRPYLHKAGFAPCDGVVAGTVHSYSVKNENDYNFALITVSRNAFFDYAVNVSSGTKMPVVSSDSILAYKVPYNNEIVSRFNDIALMETIASNVQENQKLIELRDWLLPMLMNGQASVED